MVDLKGLDGLGVERAWSVVVIFRGAGVSWEVVEGEGGGRGGGLVRRVEMCSAIFWVAPVQVA